MAANRFDEAAIARIKRDLHLLITGDGATVSDQELNTIMKGVDNLAEADDVDAIISDLLLSLLDFPFARQYLIAETRDDRNGVISQISAAVAVDMNTAETLANLALIFTDLGDENFSNRTAVLIPSTLSGYTVKFSNIKLSPPKILKIINIMIPGTLGLSDPKESLLFISSLLALVIGATLEITDNLKVELDDDLASVFLGCVAAQAKSAEKSGREATWLHPDDITKMTNKYRREAGISPMNEKEVVRNLHRLQSLRCVKHKDALWEVIERVEIRKN